MDVATVMYVVAIGAYAVGTLTGNIVMWFYLVGKHHLYEED